MEGKGEEMPFLHGQGAQPVLHGSSGMQDAPFAWGWFSPFPALLLPQGTLLALWDLGSCKLRLLQALTLLLCQEQQRNDSRAASSGKGSGGFFMEKLFSCKTALAQHHLTGVHPRIPAGLGELHLPEV